MTTISLVFPGDGRDPGVRSGVPHSLASGLTAAGARVRHLRAEPRAPFDRLLLDAVTVTRVRAGVQARSMQAMRSAAYNGPLMGRAQTWSTGQRVARADGVDGYVQVGSSYALPAGLASVTHDDMTVVQAARAGYPGIKLLSRRELRERIELQRLAFERARACCVVTRWAGDSIVEDYGIAPEKIRVVGGGRNHDPRPAVRDWSTPRFLFVGKDWERKNGPLVLRAFGRLRQAIPEATLDVVGRHPAIEQDGVTTHGWLSLDDAADRRTLDSLFERATCFVMPSKHEPSGIVFSEANAAGIPSIGSTEGGSGELVGAPGHVVHPDDEDGLVAAMTDLSDPVNAERRGAQAALRSRDYTWPCVGERVLRALELPGVPTAGLADFL